MRRCIALLLAVSAFLSSGCGSPLQVAYPEKSYFLLEVERGLPPAEVTLGPTLRISRFRISSLFEDRLLVYRIADQQYEHDFYNELFDDPARLIEEQTRQWLDESGLFENVLDASSPAPSQWLLDGRIQALFGDYRPDGGPLAVLAIQFFLIDETRSGTPVLFDRSFRIENRSQPGPAGLVAAWAEGLESMLAELELELLEQIGE